MDIARTLLSMGFKVTDIKNYLKTNYSLEEILSNPNVQIDNVVKRMLAISFYQLNIENKFIKEYI